ncbi:hypothetical protein ACFOET_16200 [Parapedobacter deserti]|uniref:Uncharacterized protein n=1 Tax=Parapedobacter deserti TaxID=1912957 RepID=A0ABV7JQM2_9SPHI
MDTITLEIKAKKLAHLLAFLKDLGFVEVLQSTPDVDQEKKTTNTNDSLVLTGIWKDRDITA